MSPADPRMPDPDMPRPDLPRDERDQLLAMEWALGLLDDADRDEAEARRASEPAFAELCQLWAERWAAFEPAPPQGAGLWARIATALRPAPLPPASTAGLPRQRLSVGPLWQSLALWRSAAAAAAALALGLLVSRPSPGPRVVTPAPVERPQPLLAAILAPEGATPASLTIAAERPGTLLVAVVEIDPGGRTPQLWLIPGDGVPRSLGLLEPAGVQRVAVSAELVGLLAEGATLAVSLEPAGGSPTGEPTGPVVATGSLTPA